MKLEDIKDDTSQNVQFDNGSYENIADELKHLQLQIKSLKKEETEITNRLIAFTTQQHEKYKKIPGNENAPPDQWSKSPEYLAVENSKLNKRSIHIFNQRQAAELQLSRLIAYKKDPVYSLKYPQTKLGKYPRGV